MATVIGITGSVAVGKSTFADDLRSALCDSVPGLSVEVVSTDSFLFSNRELDARGLSMRKGFPESFDRVALAMFLSSTRAGGVELSVPVYDHFTYDIVDDARQHVGAIDVLIVEGLALLDGEAADLLDVAIYLDADLADIERWYTGRFFAQARRAADEPGGFWDLFAGFDDGQLADAAAFTWSAINLPNYLEHVEPTRARADVVIRKAADHSIAEVRRRAP